MKIKSMRLVNYRNYGELRLDFKSGINILLGENAQGKTNALEAVYYAAISHSHRTNKDDELIKKDEDESSLRILYERLGIDSEIDIRFFRNGPRQIFLSGEKAKVRELIGKINVVLFSPEDLFLIKGAPQGRRRFLDAEISQASGVYFRDLTNYIRILNQRNALLKRIRERKADKSMLEMWDEQFCTAAARVTKKRREAVEKLSLIAGKMQRLISGDKETLSIKMQIHDAPEDLLSDELILWYNKRLKERYELDMIKGATGIGPQRDDLLFFINGENLRSFGSQGQQRTGILALKLAEIEFLYSETGEYPVLLLDDVMSELDEGRRGELLSFVGQKNIQTIVTATEKAYFPSEFVRDAFKVENGRIEKN